MTAAIITLAALTAAVVWLRRRHRQATALPDTGLRIGVVAHIVDDTTVPFLRQLGAAGVRVSVYPNGDGLASVGLRCRIEHFPTVIVVPMELQNAADFGSYFQGCLMWQDGNEPDAHGLAPTAVPAGVGISAAVTEAWLTAYVQHAYVNNPKSPLCIHAYGQPAELACRNAVARAKRVLDATGQDAVPIWVTEFGVPRRGPNAGQPSDLTAAMRYLASEPRVQRAFVYALVDDTEGYGLVVNGQPTPYFGAVQSFNARAIA